MAVRNGCPAGSNMGLLECPRAQDPLSWRRDDWRVKCGPLFPSAGPDELGCPERLRGHTGLRPAKTKVNRRNRGQNAHAIAMPDTSSAVSKVLNSFTAQHCSRHGRISKYNDYGRQTTAQNRQSVALKCESDVTNDGSRL